MRKLFASKSLIGMVHVRALPGAPFSSLKPYAIVSQAVKEAMLLAEVGFDGLIIENMHDRPYVHGPQGPEVVAMMTRVAMAIRQAVDQTRPSMVMGMQVLSGGNKDALAIARAVGLDFIRCENFVFSHVADEGLLAKAEAGELLRYRKSIGAEHVAIYCDIKKKHASHAMTADLSIEDVAEGAEFFGADGLVVTGSATGKPTDPADVASVRSVTKLPVFVGSGVAPNTVGDLFEHADALIVGSALKQGGRWENTLDKRRCLALIHARDLARRGA